MKDERGKEPYPPERWIPSGRKRVILCEGATDVTVIRGIVEKRDYVKIKNEGLIINIEGIGNLKGALETLQGERGWVNVTKIAVIADADDRPQQREKEVQGRIENQAPPNGEITYFIGPRAGQAGEIEDLLWTATANTGTEGIRKVRCEEFIRSTIQAMKATMDKKSKRYIRAFAATEEKDPTIPTHRLAKQCDFGHSVFDELADFLSEV